MSAFSRSLGSTVNSRAKSKRVNSTSLDSEIKNLQRLIRKNNNLQEQISLRAQLLEAEHGPDSTLSPTRRAIELRSTALSLQDENELLEYKLKLRKRLRERLRAMRTAADGKWIAVLLSDLNPYIYLSIHTILRSNILYPFLFLAHLPSPSPISNFPLPTSLFHLLPLPFSLTIPSHSHLASLRRSRKNSRPRSCSCESICSSRRSG